MAYFLRMLLCSTIFFMLAAGFSGCASGKSSKSSNSAEAMDATPAASSELEEAKQNAESAEWEAHRLREELYRKKNSKKPAE